MQAIWGGRGEGEERMAESPNSKLASNYCHSSNAVTLPAPCTYIINIKMYIIHCCEEYRTRTYKHFMYIHTMSLEWHHRASYIHCIYTERLPVLLIGSERWRNPQHTMCTNITSMDTYRYNHTYTHKYMYIHTLQYKKPQYLCHDCEKWRGRVHDLYSWDPLLMSWAREEGEEACLRNGCLSSSLAVALWSAFRTRARLRKSSSKGEAWKKSWIIQIIHNVWWATMSVHYFKKNTSLNHTIINSLLIIEVIWSI